MYIQLGSVFYIPVIPTFVPVRKDWLPTSSLAGPLQFPQKRELAIAQMPDKAPQASLRRAGPQEPHV